MLHSNKVLILNCFGPQNRGDAELLSNFIFLIRNQLGSSASIVGVANNVSQCKNLFTTINWLSRFGTKYIEGYPRPLRLASSISYYILLLIALILKKPLLFASKNLCKLITTIQEADYIYSCPGGYLEDSGFAYYISCLYLLVAKQYKRPETPLILAPMSIGPINSKSGRYLLNKTIHCADLIAAREAWSFNYCLNLFQTTDKFARSKIHLIPDLALYANSRDPELLCLTGDEFSKTSEFINNQLSIGRTLVGLTIVNWNFPGTKSRARSLQVNYIVEIAKTIACLTSKNNSVVIFNQVSSDLNLTRKVLSHFQLKSPSVNLINYIHVQTAEVTPPELKKLMEKCSIIIASRFHSALFALQLKKPVISVAYLPKTSAILELCGLKQFSIPIERIKKETLIKLISLAYKNKSAFSNALTTYLQNCEDFSHLFPKILQNKSHTK